MHIANCMRSSNIFPCYIIQQYSTKVDQWMKLTFRGLWLAQEIVNIREKSQLQKEKLGLASHSKSCIPQQGQHLLWLYQSSVLQGVVAYVLKSSNMNLCVRMNYVWQAMESTEELWLEFMSNLVWTSDPWSGIADMHQKGCSCLQHKKGSGSEMELFNEKLKPLVGLQSAFV